MGGRIGSSEPLRVVEGVGAGGWRAVGLAAAAGRCVLLLLVLGSAVGAGAGSDALGLSAMLDSMAMRRSPFLNCLASCSSLLTSSFCSRIVAFFAEISAVCVVDGHVSSPFSCCYRFARLNVHLVCW